MVPGVKTCWKKKKKKTLVRAHISNKFKICRGKWRCNTTRYNNGQKKLTLTKHIDNLCHNAQYKLHKVWQIRKFLKVGTASISDNSFIKIQFNYASLIWTFSRKTCYLKIEKTLKVIYDNTEIIVRYCKVTSKQIPNKSWIHMVVFHL